jgi:hypothetical protein
MGDVDVFTTTNDGRRTDCSHFAPPHLLLECVYHLVHPRDVLVLDER